MKKRSVILILITTLILEEIVLQVSHLLTFIGEKKTNLTINMIKDESIYILTHPIEITKKLIDSNNPLFYIGTLGMLIYMIVLFVKSPEKGDWKAETKQTTHGSARYARPNEIYVPSEIKGYSKKMLFNEFKKTLKENKK